MTLTERCTNVADNIIDYDHEERARIIEGLCVDFAERALRETLQVEYDPDSGKESLHAHFPSGDDNCDCFGLCGRYDTKEQAEARIAHLISETIDAAKAGTI